MKFPARLYPIIDRSFFQDSPSICGYAEALVVAGCALIQYRNKFGSARQMLDEARELRERLGEGIKLIMNDRADLCLAAGFDGLHVGQDDLSPEAARRIIGDPTPAIATSAAKAAELEMPLTAALKRCATQNPSVSGATPHQSSYGRWLGVSTHNPEQVALVDQTSADYLAIGPVFVTSSKANPDPVVGLEGVLRARGLTRKPLVAIGGITRANARSVIEAGADAVAVISDLVRDPRKSAEEFLRVLE
jgi:thiamine-phosphate pyrophosphorylase